MYHIVSKKMLVLLSCRNLKAKSSEGETHEELSPVAESDEPKGTLEAANNGRKGKRESKKRGGIAEEAIEDAART